MTGKIPTNEETQPRWTRWGNLVAALSVVATILTLALLPATLAENLPVCGYFFASFIGWAILRWGRNPWAKAARAILGPVTWGLLAVVIVLMIFGNATTEAELAEVNSVERAMLWLNEHRLPDLKDWPFTTLAVLLLLTLVSYLQPRWETVQRSKRLKDGLTLISSAVAVAASFTFFSQTYVVDPYATSAYLRLTTSLRHSRQAEVEHALSRVCAEELTKTVRALPPSARSFYGKVLQTLAAWDRARAREMLSDFIEFHERAGAPHETVSRHPEADAKPGGAGLPSPAEIVDALTVQKAREAGEERKKGVADKEMNATLGEILGVGNEHWADLISGLAEKLLEPYIGENSMIFSQAVSEYLSGVTEASLDEYQEEWRERQAEQLTKRLQGMVDGKSDAVAELVKPEVKKLADLTKQVARLAHVESAEMSAPGASTSESVAGFRKGHFQGTIRLPQKSGHRLIDELKGVRDRLDRLAEQDELAVADGSISAGTSDVAVTAPVNEVIEEARLRIAEADVAIDSGRKILLEYEKAIQLRTVTRELPHIPETGPMEAHYPRVLPLHR